MEGAKFGSETRCNRDGFRELSPYGDPLPFQRFDAGLHGWNGKAIRPSEAIFWCARDTFFGDPSGHGAEWMFENVAKACVLTTNMAWQFPAQYICYEPQYEELFRCIERDINTGIFYSAAALQFVYTCVESTLKCDCNQNITQQGIYKYLYDYKILEMMQQMSVLLGFSLIGKISAVIAQVVASKNKIEEILSPQIKF